MATIALQESLGAVQLLHDSFKAARRARHAGAWRGAPPPPLVLANVRRWDTAAGSFCADPQDVLVSGSGSIVDVQPAGRGTAAALAAADEGPPARAAVVIDCGG